MLVKLRLVCCYFVLLDFIRCVTSSVKQLRDCDKYKSNWPNETRQVFSNGITMHCQFGNWTGSQQPFDHQARRFTNLGIALPTRRKANLTFALHICGISLILIFSRTVLWRIVVLVSWVRMNRNWSQLLSQNFENRSRKEKNLLRIITRKTSALYYQRIFQDLRFVLWIWLV